MDIRNNINRFIVGVLLIVYMAPSCFGVLPKSVDSKAQKPIVSSMKLEGEIGISVNNPRINISLRDSDVKQVLRMLADKAALNIIFHDSVDGKVTLDLVNMPLNDAFKLILQITNLSYYLDDKTLIIASAKAEGVNFSKQEITVIPIKYMDASQIASFLNKNIFSIGKPGFSPTDAAIVNSAKNELVILGTQNDIKIAQKVVNQFDKPRNTKTYIVNHTTPKEMANLVCNLLAPENAGGATGGAANVAGKLTGKAAGVLTGAADDIVIGENIVACTISPKESINSETLSSLGATNLTVSYFPQRGTIAVAGGSDYQLKIVEDFIKENDVKQPQAYLEIAIIELNEDGSKTFANTWDVWGGGPFTASFAGGTTRVGRMSPPLSPTTDYYYYVDPTSGKISQESYTTMRDVSTLPMRISWQMQYVLDNQKGKVLSNPKILITNGKEATIDLTSDYIKSSQAEYLTTTSTGASTLGAVQRTYEIGDDLGINIKLTPFISPEGYVTLNIEPDYSTEKSQITDNYGNIVATLLQRRNMELKNIRIKDNETLIIGGMMKESETKSVQKIPVLGDLPVIGAIFRTTISSKGKNEMIIMLTPRILKEDSGRVSTGL